MTVSDHTVADATATQALTVSERLVAFVREQLEVGVPEAALHEAKRLLLNQLKASVGATGHPAIDILHGWKSPGAEAGPTAHVLWLGTETTPEHAAMVNGALFEVLDFHDTYIPTFLHAYSGILPAALAGAEAGKHGGAKLLTALALGIEVELAVATILMPTGYYRGFVPLGLVGSVGAATACSILGGLDDVQMRNAVGLAMCTAAGTYESVGSMALAWITALNARNGLNAYQLAKRGLDAPATAFEGDKGMLASYSDEPASKIDEVLATLGTTWRIHGQSYKTMPTETITHAPVECTLAIRERAGDREIQSIRFGVEPIVVKIADERYERFGLPSSELEARFDLRFCAAAAWIRGRFTLAEMAEAAYTDADILALRARVELVADERRTNFEGCWLEMAFTDGTTESIVIDAFKGTPNNPLSDDELFAVFRRAADGFLAPARTEDVLTAVWGLDDAPSVGAVVAVLALS
jgi:2-methylcitrate dehydratase PrpD